MRLRHLPHPAPDAGAPGGPHHTWRQKAHDRNLPLLTPAPHPFLLHPWRPRPPPPMPAPLRRALRQGQAWLLPRIRNGPFVIAAVPGGPLLWQIRSLRGRRAALLPYPLVSLSPPPPAPIGPIPSRALRQALCPLFPSETVSRRRDALHRALSIVAAQEVVVFIPERPTPRRSFASLRPDFANAQIEIWSDIFEIRLLARYLVPEAILEMALPLETRTPRPNLEVGAPTTAGSAHERLNALARLSACLMTPPDHPFFDALQKA